MRVLLLSPLPPPVGGIASWSVNVLSYFKRHGSVELIHQNTALAFRSITREGFFYRLVTGVVDTARTLAKFIFFIGIHRPDVVHITTSGSLGLAKDYILCLIAKLHGVPVVMHFRYGRIANLVSQRNWEWRILKWVITLSSKSIVLDSRSHKALLAAGFQNVIVVSNPVPPRVQFFLNTEFDQAKREDFRRVLFVGHVTPNKGVFDLVSASISLEVVDELVIVGPYEKEVKESLLAIAEGGALKITFKGALSDFEVYSQMNQASMLVLPSYSEGFPNVLIEAMAIGCPVIATDVGAVPDILGRGSQHPAGLVIRPGDVADLREAINCLATDLNRASFIKGNAMRKVKSEYSIETVCKTYEHIWQLAHRSEEVNV